MERRAEHIAFLDQCRGFAVLIVFLYHAVGIAFNRYQLEWGNWFRDFHAAKSYLALLPLTYGWAGVSIFFVVSGFCIHFSFQRQPQWSTFLHRRFFRIYPPYLVALLFFALVFPLTAVSPRSVAGTEQIVSHALLIHNFGATLFDGINPSFWTIAVEAQLYLLYPLLLGLVAKIGWRNALICLAAIEISLRGIDGIAFTVNQGGPSEWLAGSPFTYWFSWAVGAALADAFLKREPLPFRNWSGLGFIALGIGCSLVKPLAFMPFLLFSLATVAVLSKVLNGNLSFFRLPFRSSEHLRQVGIWSYSIYLLHQPLLFAVAHVARRLPHFMHFHPLSVFALCLAAWIPIVAVGAWYYRFCEKPSIQMGKNLRNTTIRVPGTNAKIEPRPVRKPIHLVG